MTRPFLNNQLSVISEKSMDLDCVVTIDIHNDQNDSILERLSLISSKHSQSEEEDVYTNEQILRVTPSPRLPIGRRRNLSLCEFSEVHNLVPRLSLPSILRNSSKTSVSSTESEKFDSLSPKWKDIFNSLDSKDGRRDGRIHKSSLQNILGTLETNSIGSVTIVTGEHRVSIARQISQADNNKDGFIDRDEFAEWVSEMELASEAGDRDTRSLNDTTMKHMETAAFAMECRTCPPPLFLVLVSLLQVTMFVYHVTHLYSDHNMRIFWTGPAPLCSLWILDPEKRFQFWRFLSYAIVHSGIGHIGLNVIIQLVVGLPLEMSHGPVRVAAVYIMGVVSGSLATSVINPVVYLAGASGGVYALIAAHLSNLILNWHEERLIIRPGGCRGGATASHGGLLRLLKLTAILAYVVVDISMAVYSNTMYGEHNTTGYTAHIAGATMGLLAGLSVLQNRRVEAWEVRLRVVCITLVSILLLTAITWQLAGNTVHKALQGLAYFPDSTPGLGHGDCAFYNLTQSYAVQWKVTKSPGANFIPKYD